MPGRFFLTRGPAEIAAAARIAPDALPQAASRRNIRPGQEILTLIAGGAFRAMRWGLIPVGRVNARGRPVMETVVNARSETVFEKSAFRGVGRCVVPADGWYEWTGPARRKTAWEIRARDGGILWFAAICDAWTAPGGAEIWQAAIVTCPPSADVAAIHDRMGVLLRTEDIPRWISGAEEEAATLMRPAGEGTLAVAEARDIDWEAP